MYNCVAALFVTLFFYHVVFISPVHQENYSENITQDFDSINYALSEASGEVNHTDNQSERMEEIKSRILKSLHMKEPPRTHVPLPVLQTLNFTNEFVGNETFNLDASEKEKIKSEFLPSDVDNTSCIDSGSHPCVSVLFNNIQQKKLRGGELWLFKKENVTEFSISHIIYIKDKEEKEISTTVLRNQASSNGWVRFNVLQMLLIENLTALEFQISSENSESVLELGENKKPFLLTDTDSESRCISKRSSSCSNESDRCCLHDLYINFADIGWDNWIIHPQGYQANFCDGACENVINLPISYHARVLMALCEKNPQKFEEAGKAQCLTCVPNAHQPLSFIYSGEDGVEVVSKLEDMSVIGCGCA